MENNESLPDNIEYAGFWLRVGAALVDTIIIIMVTLPLTYLVYGSAMLEKQGHVMGGWDFVINWLLPTVAVIVLWYCKGATPGKMVTAMKVVDEKTGLTPGLGQSVIRYFAYLVSMLPLFLGFFWIAVDKKKQGWHDKIAKTVVVKTK